MESSTASPRAARRLHLGQDHHLVAEIEARRRLVHDDGGGVLGQRAGHQHELALAAADAGVFRLGERADAEGVEGGLRLGVVLAARRRERPHVRRAAHHHHVGDAEREVRGLRLRHIGDAARDLGARQRSDRAAAEADLAALRRQQAEHGLEQRGLAGAVGAEQAHHLARPHLQVHIAPHRLAAIAERQAGARPARARS